MYEENEIIKCLVCLLLTDTGSVSLQIMFVCHKECSILEKDTSKLMFDIALGSKIFERLDRSHKYFDILQARDEKIKKQVGLYEIEAIHYPIMMSVDVNPKEYYKHYSSKDSNKRHKGVRRRSLAISFHCKSTKIRKKLKLEKLV